MSSDVRVRFAPSPTGYLHIGGARTALFNYLFARHHRGTFILRIEDTDRSRFDKGALAEIYESLRWLGLDWDEGPQAGGAAGPYVQSERAALYREHADELLRSGKAYRCFCTPDRLDRVRKERERAKAPTAYDRHCRNLPGGEAEKLLASGTPHVIRLAIPDGRTVSFDDRIRGHIEYDASVLDDLVLLKSDGLPTYHLANVVDDHHMRISHVFRGDEWIASTPRHILLYEAFGWPPPVFAHLPVILSPDGGKLSKRKGAASVMDYKRGGYLPEALFNFLALLGWSPGDDREKMSRPEMIQAFSLEKVSPKASVLDEKKLAWMNGLYLQDASVDSLRGTVVQWWKDAGVVGAEAGADDPHFAKVISLMKDRSKTIAELTENAAYFFADPAAYEEKAARKHFKERAPELLRTLARALEQAPSFDHASLEEIYRAQAEEAGVSAGKLIHPTRLAVTGVSFGPGLFELLEVLGRETVVRRMHRAAERVEKGKSHHAE
ncbi:MAG: glutamate--tRNA ligase [Chitinivibrionales bacterium]|nr:glutamate--tRNA ligase [Chitinivibrionales bacterium]MBD3397019.1 glutamate--tRNA ligase [Chitinivibrionales bacterium]